jgi:hypothetical protein
MKGDKFGTTFPKGGIWHHLSQRWYLALPFISEAENAIGIWKKVV